MNKRLRHRFRNKVAGGLFPRTVGVEEFTGVVLLAEMCEESELRELSPCAKRRRTDEVTLPLFPTSQMLGSDLATLPNKSFVS